VLAYVYNTSGIRLVNVFIPTEFPGLVRTRRGKGACLYFAGNPGLQHRAMGTGNVLKLLKRMLGQTVGDRALFTVTNAPDTLEVFAHTQAGSDRLVVNLVNAVRTAGTPTFGTAKGCPVTFAETETLPDLANIVIRFRDRDDGRAVRRVLWLPEKAELPCRREGCGTVAALKPVGVQAMIAAEYAPE